MASAAVIRCWDKGSPDPEEIENVIKADGSEGLRGLELLPMETVLKPEKVRTQTSGSMEITEGALAGFSSHRIHGYEIHMGETMAVDAIKPLCHLDQKNDVVCQERDGGQRDNVYGTYVHGILMIRMWHMICAGFWQRKRD